MPALGLCGEDVLRIFELIMFTNDGFFGIVFELTLSWELYIYLFEVCL